MVLTRWWTYRSAWGTVQPLPPRSDRRKRRAQLLYACFALAVVQGCERRDENPSVPVEESPVGAVLREATGMALEIPLTSAVQTRDRDWMIVDVERQGVRWHDVSGRETGTLGRKGGGPLEFVDLSTGFSLGGDTVALFDDAKKLAQLAVGRNRLVGALSFESWEIDRLSGSQLLGRFPTGEWALLRYRRRIPRNGISSAIVDTPVVDVGRPGERPTTVLLLPARRGVFVVTKGRARKVDLREIAPAAIALCDSGFLVVDTLGRHLYNRDGKRISTRAMPVPRILTKRTSAAAIVDRAVNDMMLGPEREQAARTLASWVSSTDSMMSTVVMDQVGNAWIRDWTGRQPSLLAVGDKVPSPRFPNERIPEYVGSGWGLQMGTSKDSTIEWRVREWHPETSKPSRVGFCGRAVEF